MVKRITIQNLWTNVVVVVAACVAPCFCYQNEPINNNNNNNDIDTLPSSNNRNIDDPYMNKRNNNNNNNNNLGRIRQIDTTSISHESGNDKRDNPRNQNNRVDNDNGKNRNGDTIDIIDTNIYRNQNTDIRAENGEYDQLGVWDYNQGSVQYVMLIVQLQGRPADLSFDDVQMIGEILTSVYNDVAQNMDGGYTPNRIESVEVLENEIDGFMDEPRTVESTTEFSFLAEVVVTCYGCGNEPADLFFNRYDPTRHRSLLGTGDFRPTESDVVNAFSMTLAEALPGVDSVLKLVQVQDNDETCLNDDERVEFEYEVVLGVFGELEDRTTDQLELLEKGFVETFNEVNILNANVCDEEQKVMTSASMIIYDSDGYELDPYEPLRRERNLDQTVATVDNDSSSNNNNNNMMNGHRRLSNTLWFAYFLTSGPCNGCPSDGCLLHDTSDSFCDLSRRRRRHRRRRHRKLTSVGGEESSYCLCSNGAEEDYVSTEAFTQKMEQTIQNLQADFGLTLISSIEYTTTDVTVKDVCCGYPNAANFTPVPNDSNFKTYVSDYIADPLSSPFGYPMNCWNVSLVTDMYEAFSGQDTFNEDLNCWDTSRVVYMEAMFENAFEFNGDISSWDTSQVQSMNWMFSGASNFDGDLNSWNTSSVETLEYMFENALSFTSDLNNWDTSSVWLMSFMFAGATSFNGNIDSWDTSQVQFMDSMFDDAVSFAGSLSNWNVSSAVVLQRMFAGASSFNGNVGNWDVSNIDFMYRVFSGATSFNGNLEGWDVSRVTSFTAMFAGATSFEGNGLNAWDTENGTSFNRMFAGASLFNADISMWNVRNLVISSYMFVDAISFNIDINMWQITNLVFAESMFERAISFSQNLCSWGIKIGARETNLTDIFQGSGCPDQRDPDRFEMPPYFCTSCTNG